jgi:hypothetical protein
MTTINIVDLVALAKGTTDTHSDIPELKALREAIDRRKQKAENETIERAAETLLSLLSDAQLVMTNRINDLRTVRNREKALLAQIKDINVAQAYANSTNNFLPLLKAMGAPISGIECIEGATNLMDVPKAFIDEYFAEKKTARTARAK